MITEEDKDQPLHADSAYRSIETETMLKEKEMTSEIHEKGYRNSPLTEEQKENNKIKSKTRARVSWNQLPSNQFLDLIQFRK